VADDRDAARRPVPQQRPSAPRRRRGTRHRAPLSDRPFSCRDGWHGCDRADLRRPRAPASSLRRAAVVSRGHVAAGGGDSGCRAPRRSRRGDRRAEGLRRAADPLPASTTGAIAVSLPAPRRGRRFQHARGNRGAPQRPRGAHRLRLDAALVARFGPFFLAGHALLRPGPLAGCRTARRDRDEPVVAASLGAGRGRRVRSGCHRRARRLRRCADAGLLVRADRARAQRAAVRASGTGRPERRARHSQAHTTPEGRREPPRERRPRRGPCRREGR
jgi:hypothetical protein